MMEEKIEVGKKSPRKKSQKNRVKVVYPYELRLKAVKLHLEDGISREVIGRELGASEGSVSNWIKAYREQGEDGLRNKPCGARRGQKKLPEPVTARIVELKKAEPSWGVKRIAQVLRRMFWLPGSPETVRTRLHEAGLMNNERAKGRRNLTRPRFFERATPNQMWQTDIFITGDFNAQFLSEMATATEGDLAVGQALLSPHRIVITLTASKLLPIQSGIDFYNDLTQQATAKLFQALDAAALTGAGGATPLGILNTANVGKVTFGGASSWAKILSFESTIGNANADGSSLGWAQSPNTRARWKAIQRAAGTSTFLQDDQNRVTGYPAYMTTELNSTAANDQCVFGNFADLVIGVFFDGAFCNFNPYTKSATNEDVYTWTLYADCGPKHPASFCISTDSAAQ